MKLSKKSLSRDEFNRLVDAVMSGRTLLKDELERDPLLHLRRGVHNETLLHFFVVEAKPDLVKELGERGAPVDTENEFGNTPLMESVILENVPMIKLLLRLGADPNYQSNREGNTAVHIAADYEKELALKTLVEYGGRLNIPNRYGETAATLIEKNGLSLP